MAIVAIGSAARRYWAAVVPAAPSPMMTNRLPPDIYPRRSISWRDDLVTVPGGRFAVPRGDASRSPQGDAAQSHGQEDAGGARPGGLGDCVRVDGDLPLVGLFAVPEVEVGL